MTAPESVELDKKFKGRQGDDLIARPDLNFKLTLGGTSLVQSLPDALERRIGAFDARRKIRSISR